MFCMLFVSVGCNGHDTILVYGPSIFTHLHLSLTSVQMATISWLGFTTGYALASPLMMRMNRVPQFTSCSSVMAASMLAIAP